MNRRGFIGVFMGALCGASIALQREATPAFSDGGVIPATLSFVPLMGDEIIIPLTSTTIFGGYTNGTREVVLRA